MHTDKMKNTNKISDSESISVNRCPSVVKPYPKYKDNKLKSRDEIKKDILSLEKETEGLLKEILE